MGLRVGGNQFYGTAELFLRRLEVALRFVGFSQLGMGHCQLRTKLDNLAEMGDRLVDLSLTQQHLRQHALRLWALWIAVHCLIESRARCNQIASGQSSDPVLIVGLPRI